MRLPNLYPAQVGSPYTTLAAPYTTGESTMTLVDATKLPDAPNIVCLAGDVAGEFTYSEKDGNTLLGVVKLPGTPNATWLVGTFAFRGIAAYDLNSLIERVAYATPAHYSPYDQAADTRIVTQLHAHTSESDGSLTPQQVVDMYSPDFDVLAITDHNMVTVQPITGMAPIVANEITMDNGHMLSLFSDYDGREETDLQTLIWRAEQAGALVVMAHPNWHNLLPIGTIENYKGFGAIEIFNAVCESDQHGKQGYSIDVWDHLLTNVSPYIWGIAVDDFHSNTAYRRQGVGRIIVFSRSTQLEDLKQAIRRGSFVADVGMTNVDLRPPIVGHDRIALNCPGATAIRFIGPGGALLSSVAGETAEYHNTGAAHYVRAEVVGRYTDGFDSDTGNWLYPYGTWTIADGLLKCTVAQNLPPAVAYLAKPTQGDLDVYFEGVFDTTPGTITPLYIGFGFHGHHATGVSGAHAMRSGYLFNFYIRGGTGGGSLTLYRNDGGAFVKLDEVVLTTPSVGTWYCFRVSRSGADIKIKCWVKGEAEPDWILEATDATYDHGTPFLVALNVTASFDNFEIDGIKSYYQPVVIGTI
jgi:hypothetical protein